MDTGSIFIAIGFVNLVSDLLVLVYPTILTWSLNMPLIRKIRISGLLSTGGCAVALTLMHL